jgi:hypothetical protein
MAAASATTGFAAVLTRTATAATTSAAPSLSTASTVSLRKWGVQWMVINENEGGCSQRRTSEESNGNLTERTQLDHDAHSSGREILRPGAHDRRR